MKTFGEVLAAARKRRGLTLKAVAARVLKDDGTPMSQPYLNDIELGHKGPPSDGMIRQLARVLGVEIEVLRFYANRVYEKPKGADPEPGQIVAAYRAFGASSIRSRPRNPQPNQVLDGEVNGEHWTERVADRTAFLLARVP
jgi:transcriptional regulator with XRE-family HTH domain